MRLPLPPKTLIQTHFEDHELAKQNKEMYADGLTRVFVNDAGCIEDLQALGGSALLEKYRSFPRGAHRADLWRYVRLFRDGGNYFDIKMCLLQPLEETFKSIYAEGKAMLQVASNIVAEARSKKEGGDGKRQRIAQPIEEGTLSTKQRDRITNVEVAERMLEATLCEDLRKQPHLIMSRGANKHHVFQGNILGCSPKHPLIVRALADAMSATPKQLDNCYLKFCLFLWKEMERDLQATPEIGWNFCPTLGPIYLLEERFFGNEKSVRVHNEATPVDGHFMLLANGRKYAATRAWGWKNGFLGAALRAVAMGGVNVALNVPQQGLTDAETDEEEEAVTAVEGPATTEEEILEKTESDAAETPPETVSPQPAAENASLVMDEPEGDDTLTPELLHRCVAVATNCTHYAGLEENEIALYVSIGLTVHKDGWLCCSQCKNRKGRSRKMFQGTDQVREHFLEQHAAVEEAQTLPEEAGIKENNISIVGTSATGAEAAADAMPEAAAVNDASTEPAGVWVAADVQSREAAAAATLPISTPETIFAQEVQWSEGALARFLQRAGRLCFPAKKEDRRAFAEALIGLHRATPHCLQNIVQQTMTKDGRTSTWDDATAEHNVRWAVHGGGTREPEYKAVIVQGEGLLWQEVKLTTYATLVNKMIMNACQEKVAGLEEVERTRCWRCICVHFNVAAREVGSTAACMPSRGGDRQYKLDMRPTDPFSQYGGRHRRLTSRQWETGVLEGRGRRIYTEM
eukprot:Skav216930  [mRNA]  locus=scaffold4872:6394:9770:- [translate_table: standard]